MTVQEKITSGAYDNHGSFVEYRARRAEIDKQFRADLEVEYGMTGHPKADKLFAMAWEHGHSSGYGDVISWYDELVELVR